MRIERAREDVEAIRANECRAWDRAISLDPSDELYMTMWAAWYRQNALLSQAVSIMGVVEQLSGSEN